MRVRSFWIWTVLFFSGFQQTQAANYQWPLPEFLGISSSFCEFRRNHFHGGLDLRAPMGTPVHAIDDGYIYRLNISATGYGKALYIMLNDGNVAAYAHLKGFPPHIEALIRQEQIKQNRYRVDFYPTAHAIPVHKGEIAAYTGDTGAGPPHLHFELRAGEDRPLNPLTHGFVVPDTRAPIFYAVKCIPIGPNSYVSDKRIRPFGRGRDGDFMLKEPQTFEGTVGVMVRVHDTINPTTNIVSPYSLEMYCDGKLLHRATYDEFSYDFTYQSDLDFDLEISAELGVGFHCLFKQPGTQLSFYESPGDQNGFIKTKDYAPGLHELRIVAKDAAGNATTALVPFHVGPAPLLAGLDTYKNSARWHVDFGQPAKFSALALSTRRAGQTLWQPVTNYDWEVPQKRVVFDSPYTDNTPFYVKIEMTDHDGHRYTPGYEIIEPEPARTSLAGINLELETEIKRGFVEVRVHCNPDLTIKPVVIARESNGAWRDITLQIPSPGEFVGAYIPRQNKPGEVQFEAYLVAANNQYISKTSKLLLSLIETDAAQSVGFDGRDFSLFFPKGSVRENFVLNLEERTRDSAGGLELCSPIYRVEPTYVLLDKMATLTVTVNPAISRQDQLAIFYKKNGHWSFLSATRQENTFMADVRKFSEYAVFRDNRPPTIGSMSPGDGARVRQHPRLSARMYDGQSGIHQDDICMYLDGQKVFAEFNDEAAFLFYNVEFALSPGNHTFTVEVKDRVGNITTRTNRFSVK